jgi:hypothetical protein
MGVVGIEAGEAYVSDKSYYVKGTSKNSSLTSFKPRMS